MRYAEIIISISHKSIDHTFTYAIPSEIDDKIAIGMRVIVPFGKGNKNYEGYVIGILTDTKVSPDKIKSIINQVGSYPVFSKNMIELAKWMKDKYYTTLTSCLQCIMPKITNDKIILYAKINYELENINEILKKTISKNNHQSRILELLLKHESIEVNEIRIILGITISPIKTLEKNNIIEIFSLEKKRDIYNINNFEKTFSLVPTKEQKDAISFIDEKIHSKQKKPILIHGVTGSGKTEIYMQVIEKIIQDGKQAIVLVPEISLTPQTVKRFIERFGNLVTVTHSRLSSGERFDQWKKAKNKDISIIVGPRSAIFTPFDNLGIIIIDEEHENTYKSETTPKFDAREVALKISEITGCIVVMGSATPSIESYYKCKIKQYDLIDIKHRVNKQLPYVNIIDMRKELIEGNRSIFSRELLNSIKDNIENNHQTILFLNRRGYSTFVSCRKCGYVMSCDNCNVNYTYHMDIDKLICHYCGKTINNPSKCPSCDSKYIKHFGVGTQKVEEYIKRLFPYVNVLRMDMDTTSKKNSHELILKKFSEGQANILIGTQMIAKGLDFPNVTLVGVIAADLSINAGDYRCGEITFQLLTQVSGRAGRASSHGKVFIQTYNPEHYSIVFSKDNNYEEFYENEISFRRQLMYPPFSNIFLVLFTGEDCKKVENSIYSLLNILRFYNKENLFNILGPSQAFISKIKKQYRWKIIVKGIEEKKLKDYVISCIEKLNEKENLIGITINITLNPLYTL